MKFRKNERKMYQNDKNIKMKHKKYHLRIVLMILLANAYLI